MRDENAKFRLLIVCSAFFAVRNLNIPSECVHGRLLMTTLSYIVTTNLITDEGFAHAEVSNKFSFWKKFVKWKIF